MSERIILRDALDKIQRGLSVAKLGLARDGVQHAKIVQIEQIAADALAAPALLAAPTILEDAIAFIESLTAVPLLMGDDIEMRLEDVQAQAKVEAVSLRKRLAKEGGEAGALIANIEAFLDMHRKGILVPPTPSIPIQLLEKALAALPEATAAPATQPGEAVREAAQAVINSATNTYRKRNGQTGTLEGEDGEMSWIVPFDQFEQLRAALSVPSSAGEAGESAPETEGMGGDTMREAWDDFEDDNDLVRDGHRHIRYAASHEAFTQAWGNGLEAAQNAARAALTAPETAAAAAQLREELARVTRERDALDAKVKSLSAHETCGCSFDLPDDVCLHHSPRLADAVKALETAREDEDAYYAALASCLERYGRMAGRYGMLRLSSFIVEAEDAVENRVPLRKLNRWIGYIQGALIQHGATTVEAEREWTRPLFRPLDFPAARAASSQGGE